MTSVTRYRTPHKIHVLSWALALEKEGSVPCHFKDCQFMALSLEEMASHYPFCACENNKYPFICPICNRRTDAIEKLTLHKLYSHSYVPCEDESRKMDEYLMKSIKKEITSFLRRSWEVFLEKKNYVKCLMRKCLFVTDSIVCMEDHYLNSCKETFWSLLKYECEFCHGRLLNDYDLKLHIKKAHDSKTYLVKNNVEPDCDFKRTQIWSEEILLYKQGKCFNDGCRFVDNYVKVLEKHYAKCDGTKKNFVTCCACGSWLLNEARLDDHKRCFHKDLDEEDFRKLSLEYEWESESHSDILYDEMSPDESDPKNGGPEVDCNRRTNTDLKKYNGVMNKASRESSTLKLLPPVFPAKNTDSIDCKQVSDRSGIQYDSDIIEINEGSLDIIDIDSSVTKKVLNDGMKLNDHKKRKRSNSHIVMGKNCIKENEKAQSVFQRRNHENLPTPLQAFANEMMKENKNTSTVPVQIKVDNKDWTVDVSTNVSQTKFSSEFPRNREALFKSLKEESYRLLKLVSKKNSIRNDVRMVFDPNENRITPFHINFKNTGSSNNKSPDDLDMTKFLNSEVEDSDDDVSNSDLSACDDRESIESPFFPSDVNSKVSNKIGSLVDEQSNDKNRFETNEDQVHSTSYFTNQCNSNVEEIDNEMPCSNEKLPTSCGSGANSENEFKAELKDDMLFEGPSQIVSLSRLNISQLGNNFMEEEANQNTLNEGDDILCLSSINHLGEEIMVKNELKQQVLPKKIIDKKTGSIIEIEIFNVGEDDQRDIIVKSEDATETCNRFESEYIIPEIDFDDNSSFRCSNEPLSDTVHRDSSNSSYGFESDTSVNLTEDKDMHNNDTSQKKAEEYIIEPNEELVLLENELPSSSMQGTESDPKGEKDPLSIDGFTGGSLFCDPENDYENSDFYSNDQNKSCPKEENIHISDNNKNLVSDNIQESIKEHTDDLALSNKWNTSNLKKYNSKTIQNDLNKINSTYSKEGVNKPSKDDESFIGFSDNADSSSKYCDFVSACSKLGYYDEMVILNQHYEIISTNRKGDKLMQAGTPSNNLSKELLQANGAHSDTVLVEKRISEKKVHPTGEETDVKPDIIDNKNLDNDPGGIFLGFNSNDNYTEFRKKSIEMTRRLSGELVDDMNKCGQNPNSTFGNIPNLNTENENNAGPEFSNKNCNPVNGKISSEKVKVNDSHIQDASLSGIKFYNQCIDNKIVGNKENKRRASLELLPKKRGRPRKNQDQQPSTINTFHDTFFSQEKNSNTALEQLNALENGDVSIIDKLPNHSVKEPSRPSSIIGIENVTSSNNDHIPPLEVMSGSTLTDLKPCMNENQASDDAPRHEVKEMEQQAADILLANECSLIDTFGKELDNIESRKGVLDKTFESLPKKKGRPKKDFRLVTNNSVDMVDVIIKTQGTSTETGEKKLITDKLEDIGDDSVDCISLTPKIENEDNALSIPSGSISRKSGMTQKHLSDSITPEIIIHYNGGPYLKEKKCEDKELDQFENSGLSVNDISDVTADEIKESNSSISGTSSIKTNGNGSSIESNKLVQKKRGRPRKNPVYLITSTPINFSSSSTLNPNVENTNTDKKNPDAADNEESIVNSLHQNNLTVNSSSFENNETHIKSVTNNEKSPTVSNQENIEDGPEMKINADAVVSSTPLKRKPGRPPKHLSLSFQGSKHVQRHRNNIRYSSLPISKESGNENISKLPVNLNESISNSTLTDKSQIENKPIEKLETTKSMLLKRKPGRPPKRLLKEQKEIIGQKEALNVSVMDGKMDLISFSSSTKDSLFQTDTVEPEDQHKIEKIKFNTISTPTSNQNKLEDKSVCEPEIKDKILNEKCSDPVLDIKPGRPLKNGNTNNYSQSSNDIAEDNSKIVSSLESSESFLSGLPINDVADIEPKHAVSITNSDISELPVKRKPGRPPKRSLLHSREIKQCKIESKSILDKDSNDSSLNAMFSNEIKENTHNKTEDKSLKDQEGYFEPPLKRKPGRPPKRLFIGEKIHQCPVEYKDSDLSINSIDLDTLSVKNSLSPEHANQKVENEEKNSLELEINGKANGQSNSSCIGQQEIEKCVIKNKDIFVNDHGSSSNEGNLLNSSSNIDSSYILYFNHTESEKKNNIMPPLKRKPGRPPKRLSMSQQEIGKCLMESTNIQNISCEDGCDKSMNSLSAIKNQENLKLEDEEKCSFEPPRKRKPGRPPKHISVGNAQQEIKKCQSESIKIEDVPVSDNNSFLNSSPPDSVLSGNSSLDISYSEVPLKRKPGRPPKNSSSGHQGIDLISNKNVTAFAAKSLSGYSEQLCKRKPGRPKKVSLEIKQIEENKSVNDLDQYRAELTDTKLIGVLPSQGMNGTFTELSNSLPKRKPGRPSKKVLVINNTNSSDLVDGSQKLVLEKSDVDVSVQSCVSSLESSVNSEITPKKRPGRPRKNTMATSTPFVIEAASSFSFNSFTDLELLNDGDIVDAEVQKKKRAGKHCKFMRSFKDKKYCKTYYTTFNTADKNIETSRIVSEEEGVLDIDSSLSHSVKSDDSCENNILETGLSQETESPFKRELTAKQKARLEKRKLLSGRVDSLTRLKNPNDKVKCALCGEIMTVKQYQKQHLLKHNFMSWLEGEEPLPLDDLDAMETLLTRGKRVNPRFIFRCDVCHLEKKSAKGLLSHRQFCGKTAKEKEGMMVSCEFCGRLMMPASLAPHLYQSHRTVTEPPPVSEELPGQIRKAAAKCLGKIATIIEENGLIKSKEDFHVDGDEEFDEIEEISLLYIPVKKKKTTKHLMNRWKNLAEENKELNCIVPTCPFKTFVIKEIVEHHKTCTVNGSQGFSCIKCNYICKIEDEMREHVKSCNPPIMVSQSDNSEDEDHEKHVVIPYLKIAEQNLKVRYKVQFFKPALKWMQEICKKYFSQQPLYPELHQNIDLWEEMDPQTSQFYNPEKSNSMMVSFQNSSWESMHALEGKVIEGDQGIAYTGGPIWGLEWCPGEGHQYLAVSSHLSMEFNFQAGSTFTGPGLVQLWSLEDISNSKSDSLTTLQFCYGVCHNDRACWNMAWCPSGGRTDSRIGLLALATTSGSIPIYAMPNPECLRYQSTRFYKPEPVLKLELWSNERWQCSAITWSKLKPHNIIAAGFVNGMVAVWNLETQSKLLRKKNVLYPFKVFQAHHSIITGVCLSPESDTYLATASYDKSFKYWDIHDTTAPHTVLKRGLFTSVAWLRHWMSAATTYDNAYTMLQTTVSLNSVRSFINPCTPMITSINSTAWSVSVSDWLNGGITSYDNGQVVLFLALRQSTYHHLDKRKFSKIILNSALRNIEVKDESADPNSKLKEKEVHNNNMPSNSYDDAIQKYGLSIRTDPDIGKNDKFHEKGSENMNDIYPLSSINRVAWNSNKKSFLYTAMGYQSGFLVVSKLSFNCKKDVNVIDELSTL